MFSTASGDGVNNIFANLSLYEDVFILPDDAIEVAGVPLINFPLLNVNVEPSGAMRTNDIISLAGLFPFSALLASKIKELTQELSITETSINLLDEEALDERADLQDVLNEYENMLGELKITYEQALSNGINLPSYDDLTNHLSQD